MQYMKARKLATGMLVAFLLLSSLALLPSVTVKAASAGTAILSFNVVDNTNIPNIPVAGAMATLTEIHTSKDYTGVSDASGYVTLSPPSGFYVLKISKSAFYDLEYSTVVKFDGISSVNLGLIQIASIPGAGTSSLTLTVTPATSGNIKLIDLNSPTKMEKSLSFTNGQTLTGLNPSDYRVVITATGRESYVNNTSLAAGANSLDITMNAAVVLNGFVYKSGVSATNVKAVLVSTDTGLLPEKRIIQATTSMNYFRFDAFAGQFYLMVDAADALTNMTVPAMDLTESRMMIVNVTAQNTQNDTSNVVFDADGWNQFDLTRNVVMDFDTPWPNIAYSYLPNLRMQIDFAFGAGADVGDGTVSADQYSQFASKVSSFGPVHAASDNLIKVNDTVYVVDQDNTPMEFTGLNGTSVSNTTGCTGTMVTPFRSLSALTDGQETYIVQGYVWCGSNADIDYRTAIALPSGYEKTTHTQTTNVNVTGYLTVMLDCLSRTGEFEGVTMTVIKGSAPPVVSFAIQRNGTEVVTALENQTLVLTANATFDALDAFSNLNFTWSFDDGKTGYGAWVRHNFSLIKTFDVMLSVKDTAGNVANLTKSVTITSSPRPDLRIVSMVFSPTSFTEGDLGTIRVNVSNVGNDIATLPHLEFYVINVDGSKTFIGNETSFTVNGSAATQLKPGEYGLFSFGWSPSSRGNFTVQVVAVAEREVNKADNTDTGTVNANEAGWKALALYGGIFAVIVVVIVLFYMRRRLPKIGKGSSKKPEGKKPEGKEPQKGKK